MNARWLIFTGALSLTMVSAHRTSGGSVIVDATDTRLTDRGGTMFLGRKPFTGIVVARDAGQRLASHTPFVDGRVDGVARTWYANGTLRDERAYRRGLEHGAHRAWWENGAPRLESSYRDGRRTGEMKEWSAAGQLFHVGHYERGAESGAQQMWNADGSIRANYVVRNGRRFGYMGAVGCTGSDSTVTEDVR